MSTLFVRPPPLPKPHPGVPWSEQMEVWKMLLRRWGPERVSQEYNRWLQRRTSSAGASPPPSGGAPINTGPSHADYIKEAHALFPWLPHMLLSVFAHAYAQSGGNERIALEGMRGSSEYERFFPGNKRPDGTLRFSEQDYGRQIEGFNRVFAYYDLPAHLFRGRYGELIAGGVGAKELEHRVDMTYLQIMSRGDELRQVYARFYGANMLSDSALLASAIDPTMSPAEFQMQIDRAAIGTAAQTHGFGIDLSSARRLQAAGYGYEAAADVYRKAKGHLPTLGDLLSRHEDPGSEFRLNDYTDAVVFGDKKLMDQITRLFATEHAQYRGQGAVRDEGGAMSGLKAR